MKARTRWTWRVGKGKPAGTVGVVGMLKSLAQRRRSLDIHLSLSVDKEGKEVSSDEGRTLQ